MHHSHPVGPLPPTSRGEQIRAMGVATLGGILEYFEFIIFVYLATYISHHFFSPDMPEWVRLMQTFGVFAAGFLVRPIGGIIMAQMGDLIGRKKIFSLTLAFMAVPTLIIGLLPGYAQIGIWAPVLLLLCRLVQGLSLGGELPGAICFVSEQVSGRRMPLALGILAGGLGLGAFLGSVVVTVLTNVLGQQAMLDYGWRIPFIIGGVFGFISVYLRRFTSETPIFQAMKAQATLSEKPPFRVLLEKHRVTLLVAMSFAAMAAVLTGAIQQFPVSFFTAYRNLPAETVTTVQTTLIFCGLSGNVLGGWLVSRGLPLLPAFLGSIAATVVCLFWTYLQTDIAHLLPAVICLGLFGGAALGLMLNFLVYAFPAQQRYTGIATCYNIPIAVIGGTILMVLTFLTRYNVAMAMLYPAFFCLLAMFGALLLWPRRYPVSPFDHEAVQGAAPQPATEPHV